MTTTSLFHSLNQELMSHSFLAKNPLLSRVSKNGSSAELATAIRQYVRLPEEIVSFLQGAANHFSVDHPIATELTRNWKQEHGSATGGVPHVELLKHRLWMDLEIDARQVTSNTATRMFLDTIATGMKRDPWFAVGQVYALEASAVPELAILVGPTINTYARLTEKTEPIKATALQDCAKMETLPVLQTRDDAFHLSMSDWFAMHILDFEVGHRDFLQEAIASTIQGEQDIESFVAGFRNVLEAMDLWWEEIGDAIAVEPLQSTS